MLNRCLVLLAAFGLACVLAGPASAEVQVKKVEYKDGDTSLVGYFYVDDELAGKRPGVLVVHEWWGLNEYARKRARMLAELGYVAFALDMYGEGKTTTERATAQQWANQHYQDLPGMRKRAQAGLDVLRGHADVDKARIAAIGYCFGGTTALQLAYSGADLAGVVSFHGNTLPASAEDAGRIKAKILVCHGADDPFVPMERVVSFTDALKGKGVDHHVVIYSGAVHTFTNPAAGNDNAAGSAYNAKADQRSWAHMRVFFGEVLEE
jgi:dienelactone hydrolase